MVGKDKISKSIHQLQTSDDDAFLISIPMNQGPASCERSLVVVQGLTEHVAVQNLPWNVCKVVKSNTRMYPPLSNALLRPCQIQIWWINSEVMHFTVCM